MKPIERVRTRAWALDVLGLPKGADSDTIKAAWRRATFERHPDRHGGDQTRFIQAKSAYDFLCKDDAAAFSVHGIAARAERTPRARPSASSPSRSRPRVEPRIEPLSPDTAAACRALFEAGETMPAAAHMRLQQNATFGPDSTKTNHEVRAVQRQGRDLTYLVATALEQGVNRVALPTGLLVNTRTPRPEILAICTQTSGKGTVTVPESVRETLFPGARSVRIRFGTAVEAITRPVSEKAPA